MINALSLLQKRTHWHTLNGMVTNLISPPVTLSGTMCLTGLNFYFKGRTPGLTGFFNKTGDNLLDYQVYMINGKGSKAVSSRNRHVLITQLPYNPVLTYKKKTRC
nr:hypothetical protein [Escherichia coli]